MSTNQKAVVFLQADMTRKENFKQDTSLVSFQLNWTKYRNKKFPK